MPYGRTLLHSKTQGDHQEQEIQVKLDHGEFTFKTDRSVFSKDRMDYGSKVLVETVLDDLNISHGSLLELGAGYGPVLITLAKALPDMILRGVEINERAYQLAVENIELNRIDNAEVILGDGTDYQAHDLVDIVVTNPPIRAGKPVIQAFMRTAYDNLVTEGLLYVVIQKKQGAPSMVKYLENLFDEVDIINRDKGYWILKAQK